jgi:hypothetical protein
MVSTAQTAIRDSEIINELLAWRCMDSIAQTAPRDSEIIKEVLSRVKHGFDSPNSP